MAKEYKALEYHSALLSLLPQGLAWSRNPDSLLSKLMLACAEELARADRVSHSLPTEINPALTVDSLEDWERVLALPDACLPSGNTLQERREAVLFKLRDTGRQDLEYWYQQAQTLGYDITIQEFWPAVCGINECTDIAGLSEKEIQANPQIAFCNVEEIRYWVNVIVHGNRLLRAICGESASPDFILDWRTAVNLECLMHRDFLAHILLTFEYQEVL